MADKEKLTKAIDDCIRALQELKKVWEETDADTEGTAPAAPTAAPFTAEVPVTPAAATVPENGGTAPAPAITPVPAVTSAPAADPAPPLMRDTTDRPNTCKACGSVLSPGAKFCLNCGAPVQATTMTPPAGGPGKFCNKCGAPVDPKNKFCMTCGSPIQ